MTTVTTHQYIDRKTHRVTTETLVADPLIRSLYSRARENVPQLFKAATSRRMSAVLGFLNFDLPFAKNGRATTARIKALGVDMSECLAGLEELNTPRKLFERKIRYWQCRPLPATPGCVVSPADARVIFGSFDHCSALFLKEKFFTFRELIGADKHQWVQAFTGGDFALLRLTPEKYHYNHVPVAGEVRDIYTLDGRYHSCNPGAVVAEVTPFSKIAGW